MGFLQYSQSVRFSKVTGTVRCRASIAWLGGTVRPSVCPIVRHPLHRAADLLLSADRQRRRPAATAPQHGVQQRMRAESR